MIDIRKLTKNILDKAEDKETELIDEMNLLEEKSVEENYYLKVKNDDIKSFNSLIEYYKGLNNNVDKINFYKFVSYVIQDEVETEKFLQELKNLSLLTSTGLFKYAEEQEKYSKQIISNFLLKLSNLDENEDNIIDEEIKNIERKIELIKDYKSYFAPIGIVKEVYDFNRFNDYLDVINLDKKTKTKTLLMALNFNTLLHEENLKSYEYKNKIDNKKLEIENAYNEVEPLNLNTDYSEEPQIIVQLLDKKEKKFDDDLEERIEKAQKLVKENKEADPYDLFVKYYEILLDNQNENDDKDLYIKAKKFLDKNIKLISNLNDIVEKDLKDTLDVYFNNEELRDEVYKTTENIERLCVYEINTLLKEYDLEEEKNIEDLNRKLKPVMLYINNNLETKNKKK